MRQNGKRNFGMHININIDDFKNLDPVYDNKTGEVLGYKKSFPDGKKTEINVHVDGHPNQKTDPNSMKPHVNYEITYPDGKKISGHVFVD